MKFTFPLDGKLQTVFQLRQTLPDFEAVTAELMNIEVFWDVTP